MRMSRKARELMEEMAGSAIPISIEEKTKRAKLRKKNRVIYQLIPMDNKRINRKKNKELRRKRRILI